jgi:integrase
MLYRTAAETGLRRKELRSLKVSSFDFINCTVSVVDALSKNRKQSTVPLRRDTTDKIKAFVASKVPSAPVFREIPDRTADMLKADLADAGIPYVDDSGRHFDFHALRHETGSLLAASGVHPKVAQAIMRHADINLTMSRYTHVFRGQESEAVAKLPDLSLPSREKQKAVATGTDGKTDLASDLAFFGGKQWTGMDGTGQAKANSAAVTAIPSHQEGAEHVPIGLTD